MNVHTYLLADQSMLYDVEVAQNIIKWASSLQIQIKSQLFDPSSMVPSIGYLHTLRRPAAIGELLKDLRCVWFPSLSKNSNWSSCNSPFFGVQIVACLRQRRYAQEICPSWEFPIGDIHKGQFDHIIRGRHVTLLSTDEYAALTVFWCTFYEDHALLTDVRWVCITGNVCEWLPALGNVHHALFLEQWEARHVPETDIHVHVVDNAEEGNSTSGYIKKLMIFPDRQ